MYTDSLPGCCSVRILYGMGINGQSTVKTREDMIRNTLNQDVSPSWDGGVICILADCQKKMWDKPLIKNGFVPLTEPFLAKAHGSKLTMYMKQINGKVCLAKKPKAKKHSLTKAAIRKKLTEVIAPRKRVFA